MNTTELSKTVKHFISKHNEQTVEHLKDNPEPWIYNYMVNDVYGECRDMGDGWRELEISSDDSWNGKPVLFEFKLVEGHNQ